VVIPCGYHPVVAAGGYQLAYTWAISGEQADYGAWADDPAYAWLTTH
jgi:5-deoxy-D-glucuronate isomerase